MFTGVGIFAYFGVRKPASDDQEALGNGYRGAQSALEVTLVLAPFLWPWYGTRTCGLGAGLDTVDSGGEDGTD